MHQQRLNKAECISTMQLHSGMLGNVLLTATGSSTMMPECAKVILRGAPASVELEWQQCFHVQQLCAVLCLQKSQHLVHRHHTLQAEQLIWVDSLQHDEGFTSFLFVAVQTHQVCYQKHCDLAVYCAWHGQRHIRLTTSGVMQWGTAFFVW